jgi:hypothetical protein
MNSRRRRVAIADGAAWERPNTEHMAVITATAKTGVAHSSALLPRPNYIRKWLLIVPSNMARVWILGERARRRHPMQFPIEREFGPREIALNTPGDQSANLPSSRRHRPLPPKGRRDRPTSLSRPPLLASKNRTGAKTSPGETKATAIAASAAPRTDFIRNNRHIGRQVEAGMLGAAPKADLILELVRAAGFKSIGAASSRCGARVPEIDPLQHHHLCP